MHMVQRSTICDSGGEKCFVLRAQTRMHRIFTSSRSKKLNPLNAFFKGPNMWKSLGAKSEL
jgi:hypothetical protein